MNDDGTFSVTQDAVKRAVLDSINAYRFQAGHSNSAESNLLENHLYDNVFTDPGMLIIDDLAVFASEIISEGQSSKEDAAEYARRIADSLVGEYGRFLSDVHKYDILNPFALFANIGLTSGTVKYTDVWTGEEKDMTIWYLSYVFVREAKTK